MTTYDTAAVTAALAGLAAPAANTVQVGDRMQDLAVYLLDAIPGVTVKKQKSKNFGGSEETDIWFQHQAHRSGLPFSDFLVPVECKNEATAISSGEISRLGTKVSNSGGTADGLFIARTKLAGGAAYENGHLAVHDELVQRPPNRGPYWSRPRHTRQAPGPCRPHRRSVHRTPNLRGLQLDLADRTSVVWTDRPAALRSGLYPPPPGVPVPAGRPAGLRGKGAPPRLRVTHWAQMWVSRGRRRDPGRRNSAVSGIGWCKDELVANDVQQLITVGSTRIGFAQNDPWWQ